MSVVTESFKLQFLENLEGDIKHKIQMIEECELENEANFNHIVDSLNASLVLIETEIDMRKVVKNG